METLRMNISTKDGNNTISIPERFLGGDVYVTITSFMSTNKQRKKVKAKDLLGVAQDSGKSLDDIRYERLMTK